MKLLKHLITWTVWSLLALYFLIIAAIHLPGVQAWLGHQVADVIGQKLGTEVRVGRVDLGFLNRIVIDSVLIRDQQSAELLRAGRLTARLNIFPLLSGQVSIASAQLFGAHLTLYRADVSLPLNAQFILDSLATKNNQEPAKTDIHIGSLIMRHSSVSYDCLNAPKTPSQLNYNHLNVSDISAHIALKVLRPDSLNVHVRRLSLREQCGLVIESLALRAEANRQQGILEGFDLQMPRSMVRIDSLKATYDLDQLPLSLALNGGLKTTLSPIDFVPLLPQLSTLNHTVSIDAAFRGDRNSVLIPSLSITSPDDYLLLEANGSWSEHQWQANCPHLHFSPMFITDAQEVFPTLPQLLQRLGNVDLTEAVGAGLDDGTFEARARLSTSAGAIHLQGSSDDKRQLTLHVETDSLNLQQLLDSPQLGLVAADAQLTYSPSFVHFEGTVPRFDFQGRTYHDIEAVITQHGDSVAGHVNIDDPLLRGHLVADLHGTSLADLRGTATVSNLQFVRPDSTTFTLNHLHLLSGYDDGERILQLQGDMGEVTMQGHFDWRTLPNSMAAYMASRISTLPGLPTNPQSPGNDLTLNLHLTSTEWLQDLLDVPLTLHHPLSLKMNLDDHNRQLDVEGHFPSFTYSNTHYTDADLRLTTEGDTTHCQISLTRQMADERSNPMRLKALAANDELQATLDWRVDRLQRDPSQALFGTVNASAFFRSDDNGKPELHVAFHQSPMTLKGSPWQIEPSNIVYSDRRIMVDHLAFTHDSHHLIIDGIASDQPTDTLSVELRDLDLAYVLTLINFRSVRFDGHATGHAFLTSPFGKLQAEAQLNVPDFQFLEGNMGSLVAHTRWNTDEKRLDIDALADDGPESLTAINGYVSPSANTIDLGIHAQGSPIRFAHSITKSFLSRLEGHAFGDLRLCGPLNNMDLLGAVTVHGEASVSPLGTTYQLRGDTIAFEPGEIEFRNVRAFDRNDNFGILTGAVHHNHLKDFTFDIHTDAHNLLAFDFPNPSGSIGGTVYANGGANIIGRSGEIIINCDVTPAPGTIFLYDVSTPDAVSQQRFITFRSVPPSDVQKLRNSEGQTSELSSANSVTTELLNSPAPSSDLRINFRINATPDATLRLLMNQQTGDAINLRGNGALTASYYNKAPFQMFGTYTVEGGTYDMTIQNIIKKNFNFQPNGTIAFSGNPFDAALNLQAVYTVNGVSLSDLSIGASFTNNTVRVNCLMNITGNAGAPKAEFDLDIPNVNTEEKQMIRSVIASDQELNQQVLYLLGIGRFYTQGNNNAAGQQQYGQTQLAMQSFLSGTISTQINELLSQVINSNDWNFGANISTGNEGWHNAEYEGLVSGRLLNNRLLINGQFGYRDNATQTSPSFIGDFDMRYLLTANGNLAVKVYNQTNDRYFTRSSLNTQGVGIIVKRDFNSLGDLFHIRRKKN